MPNICFISPHPDDIELFCGGALLHHVNQGDRVTVIMLTKGGKGTFNPFVKPDQLEIIREQETRQRYRLVQPVKLVFADFRDKEVIHSRQQVEKFLKLLESCNPDLIYIPEYLIKDCIWTHQDHINGTKSTLAAATMLNKKIIFRCYHSKQPNQFINIDAYYKESKHALRFYKSQYSINLLFFLHFMERIRARLCRKWGKKIGCTYAEGFREFYSYDVSPADFEIYENEKDINVLGA